MTTSFVPPRAVMGLPDEFAAVLPAWPTSSRCTVSTTDPPRLRSSRAILGTAPADLVGRMPEESFVYAEDAPELDAAIDRLHKATKP